ncbi:uncharacterized protein LOC108733789 isoform X2 [Agrilus planipennis]|uniref:Uncharacterized protein LOC108733789 isoform X2 n=1 Tax=Agrilus planipennis TaxID=224129 RepID=A0A1W4W9D0_AGRPL|nr:uncharacterized protein LOC108733789 isoform X2 [Agrilus planipennis]
MGRRNKNNQPRLIPAQDKRICGSICFCQLVVVISCVSFIYLTVAIYIPAYRAFHSDLELTPVMCQTINTSMLNNCSWASCGEWCLTKTSGFCPQIHVTTRQNGTIVQLQNCDKTTEFSCPNVKTQSLKKYNCNNGSECNSLTGFFNCSLGHCEYWSSAYHCHYNADGAVIDSDKDNTKLNGFFECKNSRCTKVRREFSCDRYCSRINTISGNIYISVDDSVHVAKCQKLIAFTAANGNEEGSVVEPTLVWSYHPKDIIMMSCNSIEKYGDSLNLTDCINGTMFIWDDIPKPSINFSTFWKLQDNYRQLLDAPQQFLPLQSTLMIYPTSHLYINLEGCVNTLKGECREFLRTHGRDGRNRTAPSRFPCYYNKVSVYANVYMNVTTHA